MVGKITVRLHQAKAKPLDQAATMQQQRLSDKAATVPVSLRDRQHLDILRGEPDAMTQTVQYPNVRSQQLKVSLAT